MEEISPQKEKRWWAQKYPEKYRAYIEKNKDKVPIWRKQWRERNPERAKELGRRADRKRYARDPESRRNLLIRAKYGITSKEYYTLLEKQNGLCAICGNSESAKSRFGKVLKLAIDHCHKTHRVRGLLCSGCNKAIGYVKDDPEVLIKAAEYLQAHAKDGMDVHSKSNSRKG